MERVFFIVAIVAFVAAFALIVSAIVIFVRLDVMDAIRFLRGKRTPGGSRKRLHPASRTRYGEATAPRATAARAQGIPSGPVMRAVSNGVGNDAPTTVMGAGMSADDSPTAVVAPLERMAQQAVAGATVAPASVPVTPAAPTEAPASAAGGRASAGAPVSDEVAEQPTELLAADAGESTERETGVLDESGEPSERETGVLEADASATEASDDAEPSEQETSVLGETDEPSEQETSVLGESGEPSEQETAVLDGSDEASERATGVLAQDADEFDESERPTGPLVPYDDEESERPTGPLGEPAMQAATTEERKFRFVLKQNVIVVHTGGSPKVNGEGRG